MKATDNQILMAACQIAAGALASGRVDMEKEDFAKYCVGLAQVIAEQVPEDGQNKYDDADMAMILKKYCKVNEATPVNKLASIISTGEGITSKKAMCIIYRGEYLGLVENIGTKGAAYILRRK